LAASLLPDADAVLLVIVQLSGSMGAVLHPVTPEIENRDFAPVEPEDSPLVLPARRTPIPCGSKTADLHHGRAHR
jgi:hypothetical protein